MAKKKSDPGIPADVGDDTFKEAVQKFRERVPMPADEFAQLTEDEQRKAFTVTEVTNARLVTDVFNALASALEQGTTFDDFKQAIGPQLAAAWGGEDPARLETIFRTNLNKAYNDGRHVIASAPVVRRMRPFYRMDGIDDDRQSDMCAEMMGTVLPADDPYWSSHTPPNHPNCRCVLTPLSEEEAADEGVDDEPPPVEPAAGFGVPPDEQGEDWKPDLSTISPEIRDELAARLKKTG